MRNGCSLGWHNIANMSPFMRGPTLNSIVEEGKGSLQLQATMPQLSESARYGNPDPNMRNGARLDIPRDGAIAWLSCRLGNGLRTGAVRL